MWQTNYHFERDKFFRTSSIFSRSQNLTEFKTMCNFCRTIRRKMKPRVQPGQTNFIFLIDYTTRGIVEYYDTLSKVILPSKSLFSIVCITNGSQSSTKILVDNEYNLVRRSPTNIEQIQKSFPSNATFFRTLRAVIKFYRILCKNKVVSFWADKIILREDMVEAIVFVQENQETCKFKNLTARPGKSL